MPKAKSNLAERPMGRIRPSRRAPGGPFHWGWEDKRDALMLLGQHAKVPSIPQNNSANSGLQGISWQGETA
jgi:hypothetical protein